MLGGVVKVLVASYLIAVFFVLTVAFAQEDSLLERLDGEWLTAVTITVLYLVVMLFSRWNFTAVPKRNSIKAQVEAIRKRLESEAAEAKIAEIDKTLIEETKKSIEALLTKADEILKPDWWNMFVWSRGQELAALRLLHEAKRQLARLLPLERVHSRLLTAIPQLNKLDKEEHARLIKEIEAALVASPANDKKTRSLLLEALGVIYFSRDGVSADEVSWNNRVMWLSITGLLLGVIIAVLVPKMSLFVLLGALGGFLSRLTRTLNLDKDPTNYEGYWILLFLSPVSGALAAWGGVLLIQFLIEFKVLGDVFIQLKVFDDNPLTDLKTINEKPYNLALSVMAFLFGFSERFFEQVVNFGTSKVLPGDESNK